MQRNVAQIPWRNNLTLLDKLNNTETRLHERQGKAVSNFEAALPPTDSDNFYLNVVDDLLRYPDDKPSIGLLLVRGKNRTVVEYALAGFSKPIGVAQWERQITQSLPDELKSSLPTVEEIEAELEGGVGMSLPGWKIRVLKDAGVILMEIYLQPSKMLIWISRMYFMI